MEPHSDTPDLKIRPLNTAKSKIFQLPMMKSNIIPQHPTISIMTGMAGSGKSCLARNLLERFYVMPEEKKSYYDRIFLFSPTNDDSFDGLIEEDMKFQECDPEDLEAILKHINEEIEEKGVENSGRNLLIFDDCVAEKKLMNSKSFRRVCISNRHHNASVWILTQKYHSVPRTNRLQASAVFIFNPNHSEVKRIMDEHQSGNLTAIQFEQMIRFASCDDPYSFLFINLKGPLKQRFRKNLDTLLET